MKRLNRDVLNGVQSAKHALDRLIREEQEAIAKREMAKERREVAQKKAPADVMKLAAAKERLLKLDEKHRPKGQKYGGGLVAKLDGASVAWWPPKPSEEMGS